MTLPNPYKIGDTVVITTSITAPAANGKDMIDIKGHVGTVTATPDFDRVTVFIPNDGTTSPRMPWTLGLSVVAPVLGMTTNYAEDSGG